MLAGDPSPKVFSTFDNSLGPSHLPLASLVLEAHRRRGHDSSSAQLMQAEHRGKPAHVAHTRGTHALGSRCRSQSELALVTVTSVIGVLRGSGGHGLGDPEGILVRVPWSLLHPSIEPSAEANHGGRPFKVCGDEIGWLLFDGI